MELFVGVPELGGVLPRAAQDVGAPIMVSANRFAHGQPRGKFRAAPRQLDGMRVALDSAGFVAMKLYGGYRWSPESYAALAADLKPAWWASMDYCCEPEVAGNVGARQWMTLVMLRRCRAAAEKLGIPAPMPVIQGWHPRDYVDHAAEMDGVLDGVWPSLVGVGSVCRRELEGPAGLLPVVDALDRALPAGTKLHLFGVKSTALRYLAGYDRVASADSMAWDYAARIQGAQNGARVAWKRGEKVARRARFLRAWYLRQTEAIRRPIKYQPQMKLWG